MQASKTGRHETPVTSLSTSYSNQHPKASSREDSRRIARIHFKQLSEFLETHLRKEAPSSRTSARDKLTRLTRQQFQELSTDVYDELCRRIQGNEGITPRSSKTDSMGAGTTPYLPTKDDFHPKRNQARQKLATLPKTRFKDLASDVYYELVRRYPELLEEQEEQQMQDENREGGEELDKEGEDKSKAEKRNSIQSSRRSSNDLTNNPFNSPLSGGQALLDHNAGTASAPHNRNGSLASTSSLPFTKATPRHSTVSVLQESNDQFDLPPPPAVDRLHHDSLRVDSVDGADGFSSRSISYSSVGNSIPPAPSESQNPFDNQDSRQQSIADFDNSVGDFEPPQSTNPSLTLAPKEGDDHHKTVSSFSNVSLNEFKASLENDMRNEPKRDFSTNLSKRSSDDSLPRETIETREIKDSELAEGTTQPLFYPPPRPAAAASSPLRTTFDNGDTDRLRLEFAQKESRLGRERDELKHQVIQLIEEVKNLGEREEARFAAEEQTRDYIHSLEIQLKELKDKFGFVKSELDRFKRSSGLQPPLPDNNAANISINENGAVAFETLTGLQTAIDDLIVAGRSTSPSLVLNVMKPIVNQVTLIQSDVEAWQNNTDKAESDRVNVLKEKIIATLDNLMTATRNHAMGGGLSPISLLDAAASHVSMTAIEIAKLVGLRQTSSGSVGHRIIDDKSIERSWDDSKNNIEEHSNKVTALIEHVLSSSRQHRNTQLPELSNYLHQIISSTSIITDICHNIKDSEEMFRINTVVDNLHNSNSILSEYSGDEVLEGETRKKLLSTLISIASNLKDLLRL
ncbi:hypothetical protein E3Q08_01567 [Wallemia mellicola]|uniref:GIT Spa2 homology (SHD) domain-containing protein n=1 Tax=Wallemia mellicola TaxID=1708541 RepID=A0AB74KIE4_9BASI|nr:hypothetical protein E3Q24_02094 [Wallemia mellicola]TIC07076.1 hypothetical protein E3Q16_00690 [Wallemia mellicola]TIC25966.1 hypothetical protein E3Q12_00732 [Wallemia mellicola]TIC36763.1 hypothetical protein E3Q09_01118 [Wallemia mellicola]TIC45104.1 hypothetical protein E3Q08_01567 [Wallemia mellicola]